MKEKLAEAVQKIHHAHGRKVQGTIIAHWVNRLMPFADNPKILSILDYACDGPKFPALTEIVQMLSAEASREPYKAPPPLTAEERENALKSATISMLWLYYEMGWRPDQFNGTIFCQITGIDESPRDFLERETKKYSRQQVRDWMDKR